MPLSNNQHYSIRAMSEAINKIKTPPTLLDELGIFTPKFLTTTYVNVENRGNSLTLINAVPRGALGDPARIHRGRVHTFSCLHLPKDDIVMADDVQNVRAFGTDNKAETVASLVADKLAVMKADTDYTREHLKLGALKGKILNADGTELVDIYQSFGLTRSEFTLKTAAKDELGSQLDTMINSLQRKRLGERITGWVVLCSEGFLQAVIYHASVKEAYLRYQEARTYREDMTRTSFRYKGIDFVLYDHEFGTPALADKEAIILPTGTQAFCEYFAPANMNAAVNSRALPYYASRELLPHDKGWSLHTQSNPLPLVLRPELVATLKVGA